MKQRITIAVFTTGFSGIMAQMILLRELLIVFSGNEFSIGIILANWLVMEALGSLLVGRNAERVKRLLPRDLLARVGGHAAHDPHQRRVAHPLAGKRT